jgi:hypothetical protein
MNDAINDTCDGINNHRMDDFVSAVELEVKPFDRVAELENHIREQDIIISEQQQLIEELQSAPRPARLPSESLKDSERLILLARINDLTISNNAQEIELRKQIDVLTQNQDIIFGVLKKLKKRQPGKTDTERVQKLIYYMNARPDHKAAFETLKGHFKIKDNQLNSIINAANELDPGRFSIKKDDHDKRRRWLIAKR